MSNEAKVGISEGKDGEALSKAITYAEKIECLKRKKEAPENDDEAESIIEGSD